MDADYQDRRRDHTTSRREKRWSMYSQRLEEIVAELMRPISDIRRSFDTDLSALLEEYLTEAGLHALAASEHGDEHDSPAGVVPNFAELALLLQHSASLYGRKVDFLHQHVLSVNDSLQNNTQAMAEASEETADPETPGSTRRKRKHSVANGAEFTELELEPWSGARREVEPARPPPTLPRMYIGLEPRVLAETDLQLYDYAGEPVGLPADFYVTWRLQSGLLVDELESEQADADTGLRPISLVELQKAIEAAAPPPLEPLDQSESHDDRPPTPAPTCASTPLAEETPPEPPPDLTPIPKRDRKRRSDVNVDDMLSGCFKMCINAKVRRKLLRTQEFSISCEWIERVVEQRKSVILAQRRRLRSHVTLPPGLDFHGFDSSDLDIGGFLGWSQSEGEAAEAHRRVSVRSLGAGTGTRLDPESEDDGFFEQSSLGDSDDTPLNHSINSTVEPCVPCLSWQERVAARAVAAEARGGVDVSALARTVLDACGPAPNPADHAPTPQTTPFMQVLRTAAKEETDVSRLLLATLFLANAGNVEIVQGPTLSVNSFSVRLVSRDQRLYSAAAAAEQHFLR